MTTCPTCNGTGRVTLHRFICNDCYGVGTIYGERGKLVLFVAKWNKAIKPYRKQIREAGKAFDKLAYALRDDKV